MNRLFPPARIPARIHGFRADLLAWFDLHKRDLPWRRTADPYAIWVSEIMLQQTRVAAVLDHYARWMRQFPTVAALAAAPEDEVLAAWSGLGYYRRARFLHRGAKAVVADYAGQLPQTAEELRKLPGIGAYTSAAIASIAFGESVAVVDGNVERVLLRQTGCSESGAEKAQTSLGAAEIQALANQLIDPRRPGDFNQAMMELGATICLPRNPLCLQCPVQASCKTRGEHPTAPRKPAITAEITFGLVRRQRRGATEVLLARRASDATVMPGMWELPMPSLSLPITARPEGDGKPLLILRHAIMQTNYRVAVVEEPVAGIQKDETARWLKAADLAALPLTGLARKILLRLGLLGTRQ